MDKYYEPKVSIVIPVYNGSNYLEEAIESALTQTYRNREIIVVNDGSCDDGATEKVALQYGDQIRYFQKENGGTSSALNYGIRQMQGEWFSWLSHDDLYYPEKIERQIRFIKENALHKSDAVDKNIFFTASENVDEFGNCIKRQSASQIQTIFRSVNEIQNDKELVANPIKYTFHGCGCLIHRSAFDDIGFFDESLRFLTDADMWFRLYTGGYVLHYIPEVLVKGRFHKNQVSRKIGFSYHNAEQDMFWQRSLNWLKDHCKTAEDYGYFYQFGKIAYKKTRNQEGRQAFQIAACLCPDKKVQLAAETRLLKLEASIWTLAKKVWLRVRLS